MNDAVRSTVELLVAMLAALTCLAIVTQRMRLPLSVALVVLGLGVAVVAPTHLTVSPDLVLFALLPGLVFEAAFRLHLEDLRRVAGRVVFLAIPGVAVVAAVTAVALHVGTGMPLEVGLVLGAILSATDPVAVVTAMRQAGAPRRLATLVEGESLVNDGTGVLLFAIAVANLEGGVDLGSALVAFVVALLGSVALGALVGFAATWLLSRLDDQLIELTLTVVVAYGTYLLADSIHLSETIRLSGIIATVAAAVVLGSYGRAVGLSARASESVDVVWGLVSFILTALVFLLIGLTSSFSDLTTALGGIGVAVVGMFAGRALVVYGGLGAIRQLAARTRAGRRPLDSGHRHTETQLAAGMPLGWLHVVFWSGLRGAVAFALALALPINVPQRALLQEITFGAVLFTLIVQGATARQVMTWAGIRRGDRAPMAGDGSVDIGRDD
jgi:CPA1 family monovalent cation:H+ antiporter